MRLAYPVLLVVLFPCVAANVPAQRFGQAAPEARVPNPTLVGEPARPEFAYRLDVERRMNSIAGAERVRQLPEAAAAYKQALACETGEGRPQDLARAAALYLRAAELGHPDAMLALGQLYQSGRGVARDDAAAAGWYRRSAEAGSTVGQYNLALLLAAGSGVPQDLGSAIAWYERAAQGGFAKAQFNLALLLEQRRGSPADIEHAYAWFKLAGANGIGIAGGRLAALAPSMSPEQLARADRQAEEWRAAAGAR